MSKKKEGSTGKTLLIVGGCALAALLIYPKIKEDLKNTLSGAIPDLSGFFSSISGGIGDLSSGIGAGITGGFSELGSTLSSLLKNAEDAAAKAAADAAKAAVDAAAAAAAAAADAGIQAAQDAWAKFFAGLGGGGNGNTTDNTDNTTALSWTQKIKGGAINIAEGAAILGGTAVGIRYILPPTAKATGSLIDSIASRLFATKTVAKTAKVVSAGDMNIIKIPANVGIKDLINTFKVMKGNPLKYTSKMIRPTELGGLFARLPVPFLGPGGTWREPLIKIPGLPYPTGKAPGWLQALSFYMSSGPISGGGGGGGGGYYPPEYFAGILVAPSQPGGYPIRAPAATTEQLQFMREMPPIVKVSGHPTEKEKAAFYAYYKAHGGV